jgi:DNA-binding beta-propeller fold protein YncE
MVMLTVLLPARVQATSAVAPPARTAGATLAHVRAIIRGLSVQPPHKHAHKGKRADPLYQQYALETKRSERAAVAFKDSTILYLNQLTDAVLRNPSTTVIKGGEVDEVHPPGTNHTVVTAAATASAIGTNFDVRVKGKRSVFIVVAGSLLVKNRKGNVTVARNQETTVVANKPPTTPAPVDAEAAIGWTVSISSSGWQALKTPAEFAPKGVATDSAGNVYATDYSANKVYKYSPGGKLLLSWGSQGNGPGQLDSPDGVAVDSAGNVYIADQGNDRIEKFSASGQFESQIGDTGNPGSNPGQFFSPDAIAVDSHDNLYVADQGNNRIQTFSSSGQPLLQIGGLGEPPDLSEPEGVAVDRDGNIYVADTLNDRAVKLSPDGTLETAYGAKGNGLGQLDTPLGVTVDGAGNVFLADTLNGRIQQFANNGEFLTSWGMTGDAIGQFDQPNDVFIDRSGTIYESESHRIQRLPDGAVGTG